MLNLSHYFDQSLKDVDYNNQQNANAPQMERRSYIPRNVSPSVKLVHRPVSPLDNSLSAPNYADTNDNEPYDLTEY